MLRTNSDIRRECQDGRWVGFAVLEREQLGEAKRLLIHEGQHFDAPLLNSRDRVRLWPTEIIDCRGLGASYDDGGVQVWVSYELTFVYARR